MSQNAKKPVAITTGFSIPKTKKAGLPNQTNSMLDESRNEGNGKQPTATPFSWIWKGEEYVSIPEGAYDAHCVKWIRPTWVPQWGRHSFNLKFWILAESVELTLFLNFGDNRKIPGSQSKFFKSWVLVNGGLPRRGEGMSPEIFVDPSLLYTVKVVDAAIDSEGKAKPECSIYSKVSEILKVQRP